MRVLGDWDFKGRYVLVTGAGSGIGFHIAQEFLARGAFVGAHYSTSVDGAGELLQPGVDGRCKLLQADFSDSSQVGRLWDQFLAFSSGKIDVLVNNAAAVGSGVPFSEVSENEWDEIFHINLRAPMILSRAAMAVMSAQKSGSIINLSSVGIKFGGSPTTKPYSVSKAALEALTVSLAILAAPHGVRINTVRVGPTDTAAYRKLGIKDLGSRVAKIPMQRTANPVEIAAAVLFLASDASSFVTGSILPVTGGE